MKGPPRVQFGIRRHLPPLDRIRGFRVVHKGRRVKVPLLFEQELPAIRTDAPERPQGLDAGIRSFAHVSAADMWNASGSLRCEAQSAGSSARCRAVGEVQGAAAGRRRRFSGHRKGRPSRGGRNSIASPTRL